jgi:hypothetical protein
MYKGEDQFESQDDKHIPKHSNQVHREEQSKVDGLPFWVICKANEM